MRHLGDNGQTTFIGKGRIWKSNARIKALGALDESMSALGLVRAFNRDPVINDICSTMQTELAVILTEVATDKKNARLHLRISEKELLWLDQKTSEIEQNLDKETGFFVPGKTIVSALIDFARVTIRKAERECTQLRRKWIIDNPVVIAFLNRASTLLFALEKWETRHS